MPDREKDTPKTFKYSIWDTRTADDQPNIHVEAAERANLEAKQQTEDQNESNQ